MPASRTPLTRWAAYQRAMMVAATAGALAAWMPATSHAQFGKLVKKATDKVAPSSNKATGPAPTFDENTIELGPEQVDKIIAGLTAERRILAGSGQDGVQALVKRRQATSTQLSDIDKTHDRDDETYQKTSSQVESCRSEAISASQSAHQKEAQGKAMSDPAFQQKYMQAAQAMAAANARGDTAAVRKMQLQLAQSVYPYAKDDTAAADAKCGKPVREPAWRTQRQALIKLENALTDSIRATQDAAATTGAKTSGLTAPQYATARERIETYVGRKKFNQSISGFSQKEMDALGAKTSELQQLLDDISKANLT